MSLETRFGFRHTIRLWACGLYVRESIENAEMRDSFRIVRLSGKPREKRKYDTVGKNCKPGGGKVFASFQLASAHGRRLTWSSVVPHGWI